MLLNQAFTDPQGMEFTNAVVRAITADYNEHVNTNKVASLRLDPENPQGEALVDENTNVYEGKNLHVTFGYWPTQKAHDSGKSSYTLRDPENPSESTFYLDDTELNKEKYNDLTLEGICDLYFTDEILPKLV
jgi:hypothetical protein